MALPLAGLYKSGMRNRFSWITSLVALLTLLAFRGRAQNYDTIIRNGRVVDGSGNPSRFADVAVKDGRIALIGRRSGLGSCACRRDGSAD